jgi:type II secretory pathway component PulF
MLRIAELMVWTRSLGYYLSTGMPILQTLSLIAQNSGEELAQATDEIHAAIRDGGTLTQVATQHPNLFPALGLVLFQIGEECGLLDETVRMWGDSYDDCGTPSTRSGNTCRMRDCTERKNERNSWSAWKRP